MNREQRGVVKAVAVIAALLWIVLGLRFGWPMWLWFALVVLTLAAPWLVFWRYRSWKERKLAAEPQLVEAAEPPERPAPVEQLLSRLPIRSAHPDYKFLLSGKVFWYPRPDAPGLPHADPGALAVDVVLEQAKYLVAEIPPDEGELAQYRLNAALGAERTDPSGHVSAWAGDVRLELTESDADRLRHLAEGSKRQELWQRNRDHEREKRAYLADDVLKDPGSALVWWLAREDGNVGEAVHQIGNLRRLTAAAHDTRVPAPDIDAPQWISAVPTDQPTMRSIRFEEFELQGSGWGAPQHVLAAIESLATGEERAVLGRRVAEVLAAHGHRELAELVRDTFDNRQLPGSEAS
ncbi:hypothetical protein [Saccharopolyspora spinosa]|uniref:Uncharacterized protein n=1 Tax=Saccharopolyspora spinosa TaxID=60894 RepID=A0A2N3XVD6_SACSN|nr:hypothetical protein [Saccharopolyspora spinosa]PKW14619.1 hypothetical protein A8926_2249 [Saccharopolyspora spinosa]